MSGSNALLEPAMDEASQHQSVRLLTEFTDYLWALFTRLPRLRLAIDEAALRWRFLPGFRGLEALPVRWDP